MQTTHARRPAGGGSQGPDLQRRPVVIVQIQRLCQCGGGSCGHPDSLSFYRASYAKRSLGRRNSVRLSVCLSVTRVLCDESKEPTSDIFIPHERAIILVFWCQRSPRNSNGVTPNGAAKESWGWGRLKRRCSTNILGTADRLRRCQLSSPVSVINF